MNRPKSAPESSVLTVSAELDYMDSRISEIETLVDDLDRAIQPILVIHTEKCDPGVPATAPPPTTCGLACAVAARRERLESLIRRLSSMIGRVGL